MTAKSECRPKEIVWRVRTRLGSQQPERSYRRFLSIRPRRERERRVSGVRDGERTHYCLELLVAAITLDDFGDRGDDSITVVDFEEAPSQRRRGVAAAKHERESDCIWIGRPEKRIGGNCGLVSDHCRLRVRTASADAQFPLRKFRPDLGIVRVELRRPLEGPEPTLAPLVLRRIDERCNTWSG